MEAKLFKISNEVLNKNTKTNSIEMGLNRA